jgi:subtilisin family serine protease
MTNGTGIPRQERATFGYPDLGSRGDTVPGEVVVRVHTDAVRPALGPGSLTLERAEAAPLPQAVADPLAYLDREAGVRAATPVVSTAAGRIERAALVGATAQRVALLSSVAHGEDDELAGTTIVSLSVPKLAPRVLKTLESASAIDYVEEVPLRWLSAATAPDPLRNAQWGLRAVRWFHAKMPDAEDVRVGVIDTGVDTTHPDLRGIEIDYRHRGLSARDLIGHGTHVSGIIAAVANNEVGISGVAKTALVVWKVFPDEPDDGDFFIDHLRYLRALHAVPASGAKVVNISVGGVASSKTEDRLFRRIERSGITAVAAMGNGFLAGNLPEYPGAYEDVLAVGAVSESLERSPFSNTGAHIGLVAPGSNILSTLPVRRSRFRPETEYASWSGTSMAAPHAAAAACLVAAARPNWTPRQIRGRLAATATSVPAMKKRARTTEYGSGLLDVEAALGRSHSVRRRRRRVS